MLRKLLPLLIPIATIAEVVNLSGRIMSNDLTPIAGAVVTLKEKGLSDTTDAQGNYTIAGEITSVITPQKVTHSPITIAGERISIELDKATDVTISLYNLLGRSITQPLRLYGEKGNLTLTPFQDQSIADGLYILRVTAGDNTLTTKYTIGRTSTHAGIERENIAPVAQVTTRETETLELEVTKSGQKVMDIPVTSLVAQVPDKYLIQRNISGALSGLCDAVKKIEFMLHGAAVTDTIYKEVWYNKAVKGYSGFLFMEHSDLPQEFKITINVYDSLDLLSGRSETITFNQLAGPIEIPSFDPANGAISQRIEGPTQIVVGTDVTYTRIFAIPFGTGTTFRWDDTRTAGWDDSLTENTSFSVRYDETGTFEVQSLIIDDLGRTSTVKSAIKVIDSVKKWDGTGADPVTLTQLDSLVNTPDFYNADYRPSFPDVLGARFSKQSAGLFDTWKGETQLQIALPQEEFKFHGEMLQFSNEYTPEMKYWASLALMQEVFALDMQAFIAIGAKETYTGMNKDNSQFINFDSNKGPFHIESISLKEYGSGYEKYYTHFNSGGSLSFLDYHYGKTFTMNSSYMSNAIHGASIFLRSCNEILHRSTDLKWEEALEASVDKRFGAKILLLMYNKGIFGILNDFADDLYEENWQTTAQAADINDLLPSGLNNYTIDIFTIIDKLEAQSALSLTDKTAPILDAQITKAQLLEYFVGAGGSKDALGAGGLLHHVPLTTEELTQVVANLEAAFDMVKGKAPSTTGTETVSLRYDLLSITRTIKSLLDTKPEHSTSEEVVKIVEQYSQK